MDRHFQPLLGLLCLLVPLILLVGAAALYVLWPIIKAPKQAAVTRAARKFARGYPNVTRDALQKYLRGRYLPDSPWRSPASDGTTWFLFGFLGLAIQGMMHMLSDMQMSVRSNILDGRIDRAIDALRRDEEGPDARERARRRARRE